MPTIEKDLQQVYIRRFTYLACLLWCISLLLPSFVVESNAQAFDGIYTLGLGLAFGWSVQGWAAYANIFFLFAAIALLRGQRPRVSVVAMLLLLLTLPFFKGVLVSEGSDKTSAVASWGWGAFLWVWSLLFLAVAAMITTKRRYVASKALFPIFVFSFLAIYSVHLTQSRTLNLQEQELYLSNATAFTLINPCGIELQQVDAALLPANTRITLDIAPELADIPNNSQFLYIPHLSNYQIGNFAWSTYSDAIVDVQVRQTAQLNNNPVLQAHTSKEGAVIRLLSSPTGQVLYEQHFKASRNLNGATVYCPFSTHVGIHGLKIGYDTYLFKALGVQNEPVPNLPLHEESAAVPCNIGTQNIAGTKGLRRWDDREVLVKPANLDKYAGFCSKTYIVLTSISEDTSRNSARLTTVAHVFDRQSLRRLETFRETHPCQTLIQCQDISSQKVLGVRLANDQLILQTASRELTVKRTL